MTIWLIHNQLNCFMDKHVRSLKFHWKIIIVIVIYTHDQTNPRKIISYIKTKHFDIQLTNFSD